MRRKDEGFTLIELLTVIMIIGILAAIAVPMLMNQRSKAFRTMMTSDLTAIVKSEIAWTSDNPSYTDDLNSLATEGYRASGDVTAHVKLVGTGFVACTQHASASYWLVYDSTTAAITESPTTCA